MRIEVGRLTTEQTVDLLKELIDLIPEDLLLDTLSEKLSIAQVDDLVERLP